MKPKVRAVIYDDLKRCAFPLAKKGGAMQYIKEGCESAMAKKHSFYGREATWN